MKRMSCRCAGLILAVTVFGCNRPNAETIAIKPPDDPLAPAKAVLQRYADGQPLASEATSFPKIVADVRKVDEAKADILEKGLAEIQTASPTQLPAMAKELLAKLGT